MAVSEMLNGSCQNAEWQFQKWKKVISETQNGTYLMCLTDFQDYYFEFSTFENMENLDFKKKKWQKRRLAPRPEWSSFWGVRSPIVSPQKNGSGGRIQAPKKKSSKKKLYYLTFSECEKRPERNVRNRGTSATGRLAAEGKTPFCGIGGGAV